MACLCPVLSPTTRNASNFAMFCTVGDEAVLYTVAGK